MAAYDYRCRDCDRVFEVRRGISEATTGVRCPEGHDDVARIWSAVAVGGRTSAAMPAAADAAATAGAAAATGASGGCGGGCCG